MSRFSPTALTAKRPADIISLCGEMTIYKHPLQHFNMRNFMSVVKALADEHRARILLILAGGELCVCQIVELLELAPSTVSKHVTVLKQAGLVEGRKEGRWMFYRLAENNATEEARKLTALAMKLLAGEKQIRHDARRLKAILKMDRDELCQKQNRC
jgi:DNA-binding transcriptional ArsR family regulator